jgi:hypothetical protein
VIAQSRNLVLLEENRALCRSQNSENQSQDGSLSGAALADDDEPFLWINNKRNLIQHLFLAKP